MTKIEFFEEYVKYHEPFVGKSYNKEFRYICSNMSCVNCKIYCMCSTKDKDLHLFKTHEVENFKNNIQSISYDKNRFF